MTRRCATRHTRTQPLRAAALACALGAAAGAPLAQACSIPNGPVKAWDMPAVTPGSAASAADPASKSSAAETAGANFGFGRRGNAPITGLWKVNFIAKGNTGVADGTPIDAAIATWHADGTELMNSAKPPATGNFCQGIWERTGIFTYRLNHLALGWTPDQTFVGPVSIHETVSLSFDGNSFTGDFTIVQFAADGTTIVPLRPDLPAAAISGTLAGVRVTAEE